MKAIMLLIMAAALLVGGCAHEADYADREYGMASMDAYDRMVVNKDYKYADQSVDGLEGLHAEPTMEMYHESFGEGFTQESVDTTSPGSDN